ncbi:MAG: methyltransferase domain-containing protein, partial [Proteobacteria bacterium]|nr:methyltransferase domain-containing protein [Pseudomonadota bacterium]
MSEIDNRNKWNPALYYKDSEVAREYDRVRFSSPAGRVFNYLERKIIRACFSDLPRNTVVLDFPCGTGRLAEILLESGLRVHGADISGEMLEVARKRLARFGERFTSEIADALTRIDCKPQFDASLCARVLVHFPLETQIEFMRGVASMTRERIVINHSLNSPYQRFRRQIKKL